MFTLFLYSRFVLTLLNLYVANNLLLSFTAQPARRGPACLERRIRNNEVRTSIGLKGKGWCLIRLAVEMLKEHWDFRSGQSEVQGREGITMPISNRKVYSKKALLCRAAIIVTRIILALRGLACVINLPVQKTPPQGDRASF